jgi:hypothetical protein
LLVGVLGRYSNAANDLKRARRVLAMEQRSWPERTPAPVVPRVRIADRLDEPAIDQLVRDYQAGATGWQLATQFGLARSTVIKLLKERGVVVRRPRVTDEDKAEMVRLFLDGMTQVAIAARFGRDPGLIWHVLERAGLKGRR